MIIQAVLPITFGAKARYTVYSNSNPRVAFGE
jgi:hypothetical protein